MEWLSILFWVALVVSAVGLVVAWVSTRLRLGRELDRRMTVHGEPLTLPEAYWSVRRNGVDPGLADLVEAPHHRRVATLQTYLSEPVEAAQLHERAEMVDRTLAPIWTDTDDVPRGSVAFDVAAITLGSAVASKPEMFQSVMEGTGSVADALVSWKFDHVPGSDVAGDMVGGVFAGLGGEQVAEALGALALPVGSMWSGGKRLISGVDQGLGGRRLAENAGLDLGVQGGGAVAGGAIGTMIFPVVGTFFGSVLGGRLGALAATKVRGRHLARARNEWMGRLEETGLEIGDSDFRHLVAVVDESLALKERAWAALALSDRRGLTWMWPTYRRMFVKRLGAAAEQDVIRSRQISSDVREGVRKMSKARPEVRALYWIEMGGVKKSLDVTTLLDAAGQYRREHEIAHSLS